MKIICIGRNYVDHITELGNEKPKEPVIFMKPDTAILPKKMPFFIPDQSEDVHYEVELVVKINRVGKYIDEKFAHKYYDEIGLGIDFTARDIQKRLKEKGLPWEKAKAFDGSAVVGDFMDKKNIADVKDIDFSLKKNNEIVQNGNSSLMINSIDKIISHISEYFTLKIGDLIFTGTPAGVGKVQEDDVLEGFIGDKSMFRIKVK